MSSHQNVSNRLISAVSGGHLETARELINSFGLSYSKAWSDGYALLLEATFMNHTAVTELLLESGSPCNSNHFRPAYTPLHFAALHCNVDIVKMLLNKGANVNAKNVDGKTPLFNVINNVDYGNEQDKLEVAELLLKHKADVNASDNSGTSLLHVAIVRCLKVVELLLDYGAYINCTTFADASVPPYVSRGYAPLHYAVECNLKEVSTLQLSRGADIDVKIENGITPLHIAAKKGYTHIAEEFLSHESCINYLTLKEGFTPLHIASEQGCEEIVKLLLNRGADVNACTKNTLTPLHVAMKRRDIAIINLLLKHGAKVDYNDKNGKTILQYAVEDGCLMVVESILKYCPDINNQCKRTSLKTALYGYKREKIIQALLEYGFNIISEDSNDPELLHVAVRNGYLKIVEDLLKNGADVNMLSNTTYEEGFTPLHTAAKYKQHLIAKLLISYEADINARDKSGKTPIAYAIHNCDLKMTKLLLSNNANIKDKLLRNAVRDECIEIVEALLQHGADINCRDTSGKTPIFYAIQNANLKITRLLLTNKANVKDNPELLNNAVKKKCIEIVEALLQRGADINCSDKYGRTPLHFTVLMEHEESEGIIPEIFDLHTTTKLALEKLRKDLYNSESLDIRGKMAEMLLSKGANVNARTKNGVTTLCAAIKKGYAKVIEALLKYNADLNSVEISDVLPLHLAAEIGNEELTIMLLNKGADVNAKQKDGNTSLHIAVQEWHNEVVKILLEYGAKVNSKSENDITPLHVAVIESNEKVIETLLKFGADIESTDVEGKTALHIVSEYDCAKVVETLLAYGSDINVVCRNNLTPLDYATDVTIIEALEYHIIKMKTANLYVSEQNLLSIDSLDSNDQISDLQVECEEEIEKMKNEKIHNTNISFYDILTRDTSSLANYARNENVVQILKSDDYKSKFPIYTGIIKSCFRKVMKRKQLLDQVNEIIYFVFNNLPELPDNCTDKILSYLSDEDFRIIMDACNKPLSIIDHNP